MNGSTGDRLAQGFGRTMSGVCLFKRIHDQQKCWSPWSWLRAGMWSFASNAGDTVAGGRIEPRFGGFMSV